MTQTATTAIILTHIMHFNDYEEMSYAASHVECFAKVNGVEEFEFDGDAENELVFTTTILISKAAIKRMVEHFDPKDSKFNQ